METRNDDATSKAIRIQKCFAATAKLRNWERSSSDIDFQVLEGIESPEVLKVLGRRMPLHRMPDLLSRTERFYFWKTVFEHRDVIPRDKLLKVWYTCLEDKTETWHLLHSSEGNHPEWLAVASNPLLIENRFVINNIVENKGNGWRYLRCIAGMGTRKMKMSPRMQEAFDKDNGPMFSIVCQMEGIRICHSLLVEILKGSQLSILHHLISNNLIPEKLMTLEELCCFCTVQFTDDQAIRLLSTIEKAHPGILKSVHDPFRRNLLWYAIFNRCTAWFHPNCTLTPFLLNVGCDSENRNTVGISWQEAMDGLNTTQKVDMMRMYYRFHKSKNDACAYGFNAWQLKQNQPLVALRRGKQIMENRS